jgi:hypothetical protein
VAGLQVSDLVGLLVRARQRGFGVADLVEPVQRAGCALTRISWSFDHILCEFKVGVLVDQLCRNLIQLVCSADS